MPSETEKIDWRWILITTAAVLATRLPVFFNSFFSPDEATYSALAMKILSGALPYAEAVDHKPIGIVSLYGAIYSLTGVENLLFVRIVFIVAVICTALLIGHIAEKLTGNAKAKYVSVVYAAVSVCGFASDLQAANTELFLNLDLCAAAYLCLPLFTDRRSGIYWRLALAGMLTGLAGTFKYQGAFAGAAWAIAVWTSGGTVMLRFKRLCALAAGFLAFVAAYIGVFVWLGIWDDFMEWGWRFNFVYMSCLSKSEVVFNFIRHIALVGGGWLPVLLVMKKPSGPMLKLAAPWLATTLITVAAGGRFFPHYFLMALPPLVIMAAPGFTVLSTLRRVSAVMMTVLTLVSVGGAFMWYSLKPHLREYDTKYRAVGSYISSHSAPEDTVFVWGHSPEIYYYAGRQMGARFVFTNYHSGRIWGSRLNDDIYAAGTEKFIVPQAWTELMRDLEARPPEIIVDGGAGKLERWDMHPIKRYPMLYGFVESRYRMEAIVDGVPIYRLNK